ncbi:hypothetical protein PVK06_005821 [Gossypium arboreum]|uniref:Uncharacterized protein n=1 Tax=Gossypium arboreum TaxID=29729 RepID=A0ABR0QWX2_GOSAR|nr:hypothetical protein PVK06_005821 [Gossypium arboreum]
MQRYLYYTPIPGKIGFVRVKKGGGAFIGGTRVGEHMSESAEDVIPLTKEHGVQDPYTDVLRVSIDRRSSVRRFNIDFNVPPASNTLNLSPRLQIHQMVIESDMDGEDGYDNNGPFDHKVEDYSYPDQDEVPEDIDNEGANDNENVHASSVRNPI